MSGCGLYVSVGWKPEPSVFNYLSVNLRLTAPLIGGA